MPPNGTEATAANENSKKRFKSNFNLWTLQASLKWSKKTINKYKNNNSVMNQLEVINKLSQKLYKDILLLKSQSITKNGVYPSSKYR